MGRGLPHRGGVAAVTVSAEVPERVIRVPLRSRRTNRVSGEFVAVPARRRLRRALSKGRRREEEARDDDGESKQRLHPASPSNAHAHERAAGRKRQAPSSR